MEVEEAGSAVMMMVVACVEVEGQVVLQCCGSCLCGSGGGGSAVMLMVVACLEELPYEENLNDVI